MPELPQAPGEFQGRTGSFSGYQYTSQGLGSQTVYSIEEGCQGKKHAHVSGATQFVYQSEYYYENYTIMLQSVNESYL